MKPFSLEIITPERVVFTETVTMVSVPSSTGTLEILANHVPLFTKLIEGEVKVEKTDGSHFFLAIGSGFMEITPSKTQILVTSAFKAEELNEQEILSAKQNAEKALKEKPEGDALKEAQLQYMRSNLALKFINRHKKESTPLH
jgi:F-type H+-transporting ATPase subunit epsilon